MDNTVTLYTINQYRSEDYNLIGLRCSLKPWPGNYWNEIGEDDGGAEYYLPAGYTVAEADSGEMCVWDDQGNHCDIGLEGSTPMLISAKDIKYIKKVR